MSARASQIWIPFLGIWLVLHFTIASVSASNTSITRYLGVNKWSKALVLYEYLTGTGNCFGFFAPGVISQIRVSYETKQTGRTLNRGEIVSDNPEISLRLHNLTQQFWTAAKLPEVRRSMAASMAGRVLKESPGADSVVITIKAYVLPSMAQYRSGLRPSWETNYVGTFEKGQGV